MTTSSTSVSLDADKLLEEFLVYDRAVDLVSIYEFLFTESRELPPTVTHFERYPRLVGQDGAPATPDFTVLFNDGTGIAAEIANIAMHDNSVEKLCKQLDRYARLDRLPSGAQTTAPVTTCDVLVLNPISTTNAACRRIFADRYENPEHWFSPPRKPVLVSYSPQPGIYTLQIWPAPENGTLHRGARSPNYADWVDALNIRPSMFQDIKIARPFVNDAVCPLYLATRLWIAVFPSMQGGRGTSLTTSTAEITRVLQEQYGHGRKGEVLRAMQVLVQARLATQDRAGAWHVKRVALKNEEAHKLISERLRPRPEVISIAPSSPRRRASDREPLPGQDSLFGD